jgi:hypothetical protein
MCTNLRNVRSHGGRMSIATGTIGWVRLETRNRNRRLIDRERVFHGRVRIRRN